MLKDMVPENRDLGAGLSERAQIYRGVAQSTPAPEAVDFW